MRIKENQIERIENLIEKGHIVQGSAIAGKKRHLIEIEDELYSICKENNEEVPFWVSLLQTTPVELGNCGITDDNDSFVDKKISYCQSLLKDLCSRYYIQKNLDANLEQTLEMKEQTRVSKKAIRISKYAIIISIISVIVAFIATYLTTKTTKISLDEKQYNALYQILSKDSKNGE